MESIACEAIIKAENILTNRFIVNITITDNWLSYTITYYDQIVLLLVKYTTVLRELRKLCLPITNNIKAKVIMRTKIHKKS